MNELAVLAVPCIASGSLVRLSLSAESASYLVVFFSHNKSANSTFCHGLSAKHGHSTRTSIVESICRCCVHCTWVVFVLLDVNGGSAWDSFCYLDLKRKRSVSVVNNYSTLDLYLCGFHGLYVCVCWLLTAGVFRSPLLLFVVLHMAVPSHCKSHSPCRGLDRDLLCPLVCPGLAPINKMLNC